MHLADEGDAHCVSRFDESERMIAQHGRRDAQATRVTGFPFLRIDRLLASFTAEATTMPKRRAWLQRAGALDRAGRDIEHANLAIPIEPSLASAIETCRERLLDNLLANDDAWRSLQQSAGEVPDDYATWQRWLGLYPITGRIVASRVNDLHQSAAVSAHPVSRPNAVDYRVHEQHTSAVSLDLERDALGIPLLDVAQIHALAANFAPRFTVDAHSPDDNIGSIALGDKHGDVAVQDAEPTLYFDLAFTRYGELTLPQLVYSIWFPARTADGPLDILAGALDGLTWRLTLDLDGQPLIYDAMHNCGCYHMFFPTTRLRQRHDVAGLEEPLWVPMTVSADNPEPPTIHLAYGSHYITGIDTVTKNVNARALSLANVNSLRSLATTPGGQRLSIYGEDGIIRASQRLERFLLWPLGIRSPGAMRQWGHHATAFAGRRHFDEARLIERYFVRN